MSIRHSLANTWHIAVAVTGYCVAYLAASSLDLSTTRLAISLTTASEGNVFVVGDGGYDESMAWTLTWIAGALLAALFAFGVANIYRISTYWLRRPIRSFLNWRSNPLFSIPWSKYVIDRSPLHAISCAIAFVVLRLLAAVNNAMIVIGDIGPLGTAIDAVAQHTSPLAGFILVIAAIYVVLVLSVSVVVARTILRRGEGGRG